MHNPSSIHAPAVTAASRTPSPARRPWLSAIASLALGLGVTAAQAAINDPAGDFVAGFGGAPTALGDVDVRSASVTYDPVSDSFSFVATLNADIGSTKDVFYVWGVDRGAGTARFAANGIGGVLFDAIVVFNQDGSGRTTLLNGAPTTTPFPAGTLQIDHATITGVISGSLLPSEGKAKADYTWNLWPRDPAFGNGFGAISDFAPDNSNFATTAASAVAPVPEPSTVALMALGLAGLVAARRGGRRA